MVVRYLSDAELYHHGVKGQKWGVRRYQNPDGSLTDKGKAKLEKLRTKNSTEIQTRLDRHEAEYNKEKKKLTEKFVNTALKSKDPANDKRVKKIQKRMFASSAKHAAGKKALENELKLIKNYSLDDFKKERKYVNGQIATTAALSAVMAAGIGIATGMAGSAVVPITVSTGVSAQAKKDYRTELYKKRYSD